MAISEEAQRRIALVGVLCSVPVFVVAVVLTLGFGETLISWAESWPGGPAGFTASLGVVNGLSLLLVAVACLAYAWPERTPSWLRMSTRACLAGAVAGGLTTVLTAVPLASTLRPRGQEPYDCDVQSELGCFLRTLHSDAVTAGWISLLVVTGVGSAVLTWLFVGGRPGQDEPAGRPR